MLCRGAGIPAGDCRTVPCKPRGGGDPRRLSLNGFHAFPDKEAAYREVFRVLKPGGTFCGCFYVNGEHRRTDWFVRHVYEKAGFFTPPYETVSSLKARLEGMYVDVDMGSLKSMAWFVCRKAKQNRS